MSGSLEPSRDSGYGIRDSLAAALLYAALTVAMTYPVALRMVHDIAGDLGDPLLNAWILAWDATHLGRGWWNANIFHPHPLALAYSEHLLAQAIQILPIYAVTRNAVLCYNLLFLSTFVLSGLGMFLLARELTGSRTAAFVAGLAYAFAPYRFSSLSHLQVLSSAWMAFALYGFRRYFETGRVRPLAGGVAAWLMQNLSCGYYLLFFSPIVILSIVWEMTTRARWRDARTLMQVTAGCAVVALATAPFLLPYLELRRLGFSPRMLAETSRFSADTHAYLTADPDLRIIGRFVRSHPKAEGSLFPGFTITTLAAIAMIVTGRQVRDRTGPRYANALAWLLATASAILVLLAFGWTLRLPFLKITSFARQLAIVVALIVALFAVSASARTTARRWLAHPVGMFSALALFAIVMSFGPYIHAKGRLIADPNLYAFFYNFVPGFDGLRAPARFGMIVALALAVLAGFGVRHIEMGQIAGLPPSRVRRFGEPRQSSLGYQAGGGGKGPRHVVALAAALILVEACAVPLGVNKNSVVYTQLRLTPLPATLALDPAAADTYRFVAALPASAAIVELPLGEPAFDVRYMFYSTRHWKRLVNGYSGGEPPAYYDLNQALQDVFGRPDRAWERLIASHATHAIVHESFYEADRGARISVWLRSRGAREVAAFGNDRIFALHP